MTDQAKPLPSQKYLLGLFDYCPDTGEFLWKKNGVVAGSLTKPGRKRYRQIRLDGRTVYVHRVVWKMMTGHDPEVIDHINGVGTDNRWVNLRSTTITQNTLNRSVGKNNRTGVSGVFYMVGKDRWRAQIGGSKNRKVLGVFRTFDEAVAARKAAEVEYGYYDRSTVSETKNLTE